MRGVVYVGSIVLAVLTGAVLLACGSAPDSPAADRRDAGAPTDGTARVPANPPGRDAADDEPSGRVLAAARARTAVLAGPEVDWGELAVLEAGEVVTVLGQHSPPSRAPMWLEVEATAATGWVLAEVLQITAGTLTTLGDTYRPPEATVQRDGIAVRAAAAAGAEPVALVDAGVSLTAIGRDLDGGFVAVVGDAVPLVGWVAADEITTEGISASDLPLRLHRGAWLLDPVTNPRLLAAEPFDRVRATAWLPTDAAVPCPDAVPAASIERAAVFIELCDLRAAPTGEHYARVADGGGLEVLDALGRRTAFTPLAGDRVAHDQDPLAQELFWAPDGSALAVLETFNLADSRTTELGGWAHPLTLLIPGHPNVDLGLGRTPSWTADGTLYFVSDSAVVSFNAVTMTRQTTDSRAASATVGPSGRFVVRELGGTLRVIDLRSLVEVHVGRGQLPSGPWTVRSSPTSLTTASRSSSLATRHSMQSGGGVAPGMDR